MASPEMLLENLNGALRDLQGAAGALHDERIDNELQPIMQRLLLAQVLGRSTIIAVCGSQGAGKTTLVATLYGLECNETSWLRPNQGRGEHLPVLIQEDRECTVAQGYVRELVRPEGRAHCVELVETLVDPDAFNDACRGKRESALLPVLRVPARFFPHDNQALMLLPGYEAPTLANRRWQELVRQGVMGASGCVLVTDETRAANHQQQDILGDRVKGMPSMASPLVVVTRTEDYAADHERLSATQQTIARTFGIDVSRGDHPVICAGVGNEAYVAQWMPELKKALCLLTARAPTHRNAQLAHLERTLKDLSTVLRVLSSRAQPFLSQHGETDNGARAMVQNMLNVFDQARTSLRKKLEHDVRHAFSERHTKARRVLLELLEKNHEGILNKLVNIRDTASKSQLKLEDDLLEAWNHDGPVLNVLTKVASDLATAELRTPEFPLPPVPEKGGDAVALLGYADSGKNDAAVWKKPDQDMLDNLKLIFVSRQQIDPNQDPHSNASLEETIRLLPVLGMEYARLASLMPALVGVDERGFRLPQAEMDQVMTRMHEQFSQFHGQATNIIRGIALVMSLDFLADGKIDSIPAIGDAVTHVFTGHAAAGAGTAAASGTAATIGGVVAGAVMIGALALLVVREMRNHDRVVKDFAEEALHNIRDRHVDHFMLHFDHLMDLLRERLRYALHRRYGLDEHLMEQDRLSHAFAEVRRRHRELSDGIARSGAALDAFAVSA